ncbi:MAG TPA: FAD-dependent monooxygenase [Acetobacteraceae bacterium]|jgi:salicylate hydroxylase/6-hydroxynicotinate 3-monooxygenase|nr:FAD-dependent monooxygenase [Acetobacteraceae bacterium]
MTKLSVAIVGAGIGGLAAAACLRRIGIDVTIYEQAQRFARVGAGIQQSPNAVRVLRRLGLEPQLRDIAFQPAAALNRQSDTGELLWERAMGAASEERYGAPYLVLHRGDLHAVLASAVPDAVIQRGRKLVGLEQHGGSVRMDFADGSSAEANVVIGADGVHSVVRESLFGAERPAFTGRVAYRTVFPAGLLRGAGIDDQSKWWGPDRHIVIYYVNPQRSEVYFVTSTPEPDFTQESWSTTGDMAVLRDAYRDFHPTVRSVLDAAPSAHKWALVVRDPLPRWTEGNIALLGDACHPMTPYMAQGAGTSIEDAAVLSRCLDGVDPDGVAAALRRYEATRKPRTSEIQALSRANDMNRFKAANELVYGYDAWTTSLAEVG